MNIIILGPPGSGKGTQSTFLVDNFKFTHLSTGDLLRDEIANQSELGKQAKSYMDAGQYVPTSLMNALVALKVTAVRNNMILDGYPRTLEQVKFLEDTFIKENLKLDLVLSLDIQEETLKARLLARLTCPKCKTVYNENFHPPKVAGTCDNDQTPLVKRSDDSDASKVLVRLATYNKETKPLIDYYSNKNLLKTIDANQDSESIHRQIMALIKEHKNG